MNSSDRICRWNGLGLIVAASVLLNPTVSLAAKSKEPLATKMRKMEQNLRELLPIVVSNRKFANPKNQAKFRKATQKMASMAHAVDLEKLKKKGKKIDPSIEMIADLFDGEAKRAWKELQSGRIQYSRRLVQGLTTFCIHCHTSSGMGPQFEASPKADDLKGLTAYEKANFLTATRKFDAALNQYQSVLSNAQYAKRRKIEWENSVRKALAITVRVKSDPQATEEIIVRALQTPSISEFFREDVAEWKKSTEEWKKEGKRKPKTEAGLLAEAKLLFSRAVQKQKYASDRSADVLYLRATAVAHELLRQYPESQNVAQVLYFLGMGYDALQNMGLWYLGELYYEACINKAPHTPVAGQCYRRLEESIYLGYSGSGGVSIPTSVEKKLQRLKQKSGASKNQSS